MGTPIPQEIPAKKPFSLIKCLWAIFKGMDQSLHARFMRAFPRALPVLDALLEWLFGIVTHSAFALIAALLLGVLVLSGVINTIVFLSIFVAWAVAVLWIARAKPVRALTVMFRFIFIGAIAVVLGMIGNGFGNWAVREYNRSKAAEHVGDKAPQPKSAPAEKLPEPEPHDAAREKSAEILKEPPIYGTTDKVEAKPKHHGTEDKPTAKVEHLPAPPPNSENHSEEAKEPLVSPPSQTGPITSAKTEPQTIVQVAPVFGNLKQRALNLSWEIMQDLLEHGWPRPLPGEEFPKNRVIQSLPTKPEDMQDWDHMRSMFFRLRCFDKARGMRDEFSQLHLHDEHLDDFFKSQEMHEQAAKQSAAVGHPFTVYEQDILPQQIEEVAEGLKALAN